MNYSRALQRLVAFGLSAMFLLAARSKLKSPGVVRRSLLDFGTPDSISSPGARLLPAVEVGIALLLVFPRTLRIGAIAATIILSVFTAVVLQSLAKSRHPKCACFGSMDSRPISLNTVGRNVTLISVSGWLVAATKMPTKTEVRATIIRMNGASMWRFGVVVILIVHSAIILRLLKQFGDIVLSMKPDPGGPDIGVAVPELDLENLALDASAYRMESPSRGQTMLVFTSTSCEYCKDIYPELESSTDGTRLWIILSGPREEADSVAANSSLPILLWDEHGSFMSRLGVFATPSALMVDERGRVASPTVSGAKEVIRLSSQI